jgi:hypothetical protein
LKFKSYSQKTWFIKMLFIISKMLLNPPTSIFNSKNFSGVISPDLRSKGEGMGGEEDGRGREGERDGRGIKWRERKGSGREGERGEGKGWTPQGPVPPPPPKLLG